MYAARRELVHHHALLRARRGDAGRALRQRPPRRGDDDRLPGAQRLLDRRRRQPQLLRRAARGRRAHLRVCGGLLHAKTLTMDGEVTLIGSANIDRRSFDLNYENNILFYDPA